MSEQDTLSRKKTQKFLFDRNNFDDGYIEETEEEVPPPPVFSEHDLENAQKDSFIRGKAEGLAEAEKSHQKYISVLLENIGKTLPSLLEQEDRRNALYEQEAVELSYAIFKKLFPVLNEKHGLDEIIHVIGTILDSRKDKPEIIIDVQTGYGKDIQNMVDTLLKSTVSTGKITVCEQAGLGPADCRLSWQDGGGARNAEQLAEKIENHLKQTLADKAFVADNGKSTGNPDEPDAPLQSPETETNND